MTLVENSHYIILVIFKAKKHSWEELYSIICYKIKLTNFNTICIILIYIMFLIHIFYTCIKYVWVFSLSKF